MPSKSKEKSVPSSASNNFCKSEPGKCASRKKKGSSEKICIRPNSYHQYLRDTKGVKKSMKERIADYKKLSNDARVLLRIKRCGGMQPNLIVRRDRTAAAAVDDDEDDVPLSVRLAKRKKEIEMATIKELEKIDKGSVIAAKDANEVKRAAVAPVPVLPTSYNFDFSTPIPLPNIEKSRKIIVRLTRTVNKVLTDYSKVKHGIEIYEDYYTPMFEAIFERLGLKQLGWKIGIHICERTTGRTFYHKKLISLSLYLLRQASVEDVTNTFMHECAHALCPIGARHGPVWKNKMRELGRKPIKHHSMIFSERGLAKWEGRILKVI